MKTRLLWTAAAGALAVPVGMWAFTLGYGLPFGVYLHDVGRVSALAGVVLLIIQYGLSSRFHWLERGIGLDRLFRAHRRVGVGAVSAILLHPILLVLSERLQGYTSPWGGLKLLGLLALVALMAASGAAMTQGRLLHRYDTWKTAHRVAYAVFPLAFVHSVLIGHTVRSGPLFVYWCGLAAVFLALSSGKIARLLAIRRRPYRVASVDRETHDTWTLRLEGKPVDYRPGQFMAIQLERGGKLSPSHPFTLSSSPSRDGLAMTAKAVGDFTNRLGRTSPGDRAFIDAPFGTFSYLWHDAPRLVFIAGGIGITPFVSMLRHLQDTDPHRNVLLLWANKTEDDIAFREELDRIVSDMPELKVVHVLSRVQDWPGEKGRIDAALLSRYLCGIGSSRFFVCGPPPFMASVITALRGLGVPKDRIHHERFSF